MMRVLDSLKDKLIDLVSEPVEYEPVIKEERCDMPRDKRGKLVKFNTRRGEVQFHTDKPEPPAPVPAPAPEPTPPPRDDYYSKPRIGRAMPRITPKTQRLRR